MLNKYIHVFEKGEYVCLYNAITMDVLYAKKEVLSDTEKLPQKYVTDFDYYKEAQNRIQKYLKPNINTIYMILNETCNMSCDYCRYIQKLPKDYVGVVMDVETGKGIINQFLNEMQFAPVSGH